VYGWVWGALLVGCFVDEPAATSATMSASATVSASTGGSSSSGSSTAASEPSGAGSTTEATEATEATEGSGESSSGRTTDDCPPCVEPPSPCTASEGTCVDGTCIYEQVAPDTPCEDDDPCTVNDACDESGSCVGAPMQCTQTNAIGSCQGGTCGAWECKEPWANCDDDWENGCEVPVGVANQCDVHGLSPDGCWTAYCGSSEGEGAVNFGDYYCSSCETCMTPEEGFVQWCSHGSGTWFDADAGVCPEKDENVACEP